MIVKIPENSCNRLARFLNLIDYRPEVRRTALKPPEYISLVLNSKVASDALYYDLLLVFLASTQ